MDYRAIITPPEQQAAEAMERRRQNAILRAQAWGNAPIGSEPQDAAPAKKVNKRSERCSVIRSSALADYDRIRQAHPDAYQKDIYDAVARRHNTTPMTVRNWVRFRNNGQ